MLKEKNLKANFIYNLISQIVTVITPFITTPYLARILHESGTGQVSYTASIISYFTLFAGLSFGTYGQREIAKLRDDITKKSIVFWEIFFSKAILTIISLSVFFLLYFCVGYGERYNTLMLVQSIYILSVAFDIGFLFSGEEDFKTIALRTTLINVVGIICVFLFVKTEDDVWIYVLCKSVIQIASYIVMWLSIKKYIVKVDKKELKLFRNFKSVLMIFIPSVVVTVFTTLDKSMIGWLSPNADYNNGCYDRAYSMNSVVYTVTALYSTITFPRNSVLYKNGDIEGMQKNINNSCRYGLLISVMFFVGFTTLSKNFCSWFLGDGYADVPTLVIIMSVRVLLAPIIQELGNLFVIIGKESFYLISVTAGAVLNVIGNYFMIPHWGAIGAAIATAATEVVIAITMIVISLVYRNVKFRYKAILQSLWKDVIAGVGMFFVCFYMQKAFSYSILTFLLIGVVGVVTYGVIALILRESFIIHTLDWAINKLKRKKSDS